MLASSDSKKVADAIKGISDISDIAKIFHGANISDEFAEAALKAGHLENNTADVISKMHELEASSSGISGLKTAFSGLAATIGISTTALGVLTGALAAVTIGFGVYRAQQQHLQEQIQQTKEDSSVLEKKNKSLDDNIQKVQELKESLASGTLTEQEAYNTKSQLLDIQSQLSDSYGEQADGIDLVNGKLDEQIEKMHQLKVENAKSWLNDPDHEEAYKKANKAMTKDDYESFFGNTPTLDMLGSEPQKSEYTNSDTHKEMLKRYRNSKSQIEEIQKAAEQAGLKQYNGVATGQFQLGVENETVTGADEKLSSFLATPGSWIFTAVNGPQR